MVEKIKKENKTEKIKKTDNIAKVLSEHPETAEVFMEQGFGCLGCAASHFETIEQGAEAHGIDVEKLMKALNKAVK